MTITATELRSKLYRVLDAIPETGEPVEIVRRGRTLRIVPDASPCRLDRLVERSDAVTGDPDEVVDIDWSEMLRRPSSRAATYSPPTVGCWSTPRARGGRGSRP